MHSQLFHHHPPNVFTQKEWPALLAIGLLDEEKLGTLQAIAESVDLSTEGDEADILDRLRKYVHATGGGKRGGKMGGPKSGNPSTSTTEKEPANKKRRARRSPKNAAASTNTVTPATGPASRGRSDSTSTTDPESSSSEEDTAQPRRKRLRVSTSDSDEALKLYGDDYNKLKRLYELAFQKDFPTGKQLGNNDIRMKLWHHNFRRNQSK